jgi:16S rRNA (uracil1498-N3)-methyltransferase
MHRFYFPNLNPSDKSVQITSSDEVHHIKNVLRLQKGEEITLFDGNDIVVIGKIVFLEKNIGVEILEQKKIFRNGPRILLACAVPKRTKFDWIVEKATELGVDEIIPLKTKRTEINLSDERATKKILRFEKIALSASKQSKRFDLPKIHPMTDFVKALKILSGSTMIIPSLLGEQKNLFEILNHISPKTISFLIGPEGDFTTYEYKQAQEAGAISVTLGENILRVETAALAVLSAVRVFYASPHK